MKREELIKSARKLYDSKWPNETLKKVLEETFPELRESEDERIRKALIQFLTSIKGISESGRTSWAVRKEDAEMCKSFIFYLEKLKEQKPAWSKEDERIREAISYAICAAAHPDGTLINYVIKEEALAYLEKQKKQDKCPEYCVRSHCVGCPIYEKQKEQKPYTYDESKQAAEDRYNDEFSTGEYCHEQSFLWGFEEGVEWCEHHKNPCKEQKPAEWSEDFEENIRILLHDKLTWHSDDGSMSSTVLIDDKTLKDIINGIWFYVGKEALKYPNKELSQPEWNEDWREEDIQTRFAFYTYKDDPSVLYLSNVFVEEASRNHGFGTRILKAAEKAAEAIGAITICLKVKQGSPANAWYRKRGYGYETFEDGYDWLKKKLEYLKPDKSAEWSKKDKEIVVNLRYILNGYAFEHSGLDVNGDYMEQDYIDADNWLNSLPERFNLQPQQEWSEEDENYYDTIVRKLQVIGDDSGLTLNQIDFLDKHRPQPHWKPSEEQLDALLASYTKDEGVYDYYALESLYNELSKL